VIERTTEVPLLRRFAHELVPEALAAPRLAAYSHEDIEAARLAWAGRIYDEYRSVAIFSELLQLLADVEAPFAALCAVHRLIGDELRHTELTARVVEWLGGTADLVIDLADSGLPPRSETKACRAVRIVAREIVAAEEESVLVLAAYRDAASDPAIRAVFSALLADEVRHAGAGRAVLAELSRVLAAETRELRAELPELLAADRAQLREAYRQSARGGPGRALGACLEPADLERVWARKPDRALAR
jgi:hypothetical protein